jgi:hypothetical protein
MSPSCVAGGAAVVVTLITIGGFSRDAPKPEMVSFPMRIVSSPQAR